MPYSLDATTSPANDLNVLRDDLRLFKKQLTTLFERLETLEGFLPESQGQNLAVTVLCVPYLLDATRLAGPAATSPANDSKRFKARLKMRCERLKTL